MSIHEKIRTMWKESLDRGENPPPLSEVLSRFSDEPIPLSDSEMEYGKKVAERVAAALRNKAAQ